MNSLEDVLFAAKKIKSQLIYNMAKAEGNTHTIQDVITIVEMGVTVGGRKLQEQQQVVQIAQAWDYLIDLIQTGDFIFSQKLALEFNQIVASADFNSVGRSRDRNVMITGTDCTPPLPLKLPELWADLEKRIASNQNPLDKAFDVFLIIARTQFFNDGNKRTGQLMMNGILLSNNLHVVTFPDKILTEYFGELIAYYETGNDVAIKKLLHRRQREMEQAFAKLD